MSSAKNWLEGARPHTWANAFAPVIAGTGAAAGIDSADPARALLALVVAWALIVGVNYANDYSDGIRGTDDDRTGPLRLTGSGIARPEQVKLAAFIAFGIASVAGLALTAVSGAWWMLLVGALCVAAAWFYTGGKNPYGYRGFGEAAVFVFFGLVAVLGTEYTQAERITVPGVALAVGVGAMSAAVNLTNNVRDIPSDTAAGKITLAVTLGDSRSRQLYTILTLAPVLLTAVISVYAWPALVGLAYLPVMLQAVRIVNGGANGRELIRVLGMTGRAMLLWAVAVSFALAI